MEWRHLFNNCISSYLENSSVTLGFAFTLSSFVLLKICFLKFLRLLLLREVSEM